MKTYHRRIIKTPIGDMVGVADDNSIVELDFAGGEQLFYNSSHPLLLRLEWELSEYFSQKRRKFTLPLSPCGTVFQKRVWDVLCKIPYGEHVSYAYEAVLLGNERATRAVANANGKNPIAILIPCHRVISSNGSIGGYSGGVDKKEFLLRLEGAKGVKGLS